MMSGKQLVQPRVERSSWDYLLDVRHNGVAMLPFWTPERRATILRRAGTSIGVGTRIHPCDLGARTVIGEWCYVGPRCLLDDTADLTLGDRVALAPGVLLLTGSHEHSDPRLRAGKHHDEPVNIGSGCWLSAGVIVLPGVTIGEGCVIGAGSVVTKDCAPHGLYVGSPARFVRDLAT